MLKSLLEQQSLPTLRFQISYSAYECTKIINSMTRKNDCKRCKTTPIRPITTSHLSLHPFRAITFTISHFGSTQESFYPQSSAPVVINHRFGFSTSIHNEEEGQVKISNTQQFLELGKEAVRFLANETYTRFRSKHKAIVSSGDFIAQNV